MEPAASASAPLAAAHANPNRALKLIVCLAPGLRGAARLTSGGSPRRIGVDNRTRLPDDVGDRYGCEPARPRASMQMPPNHANPLPDVAPAFSAARWESP